MAHQPNEPEPSYATLEAYAELRTRELLPLLQPYIEATDRYGDLICQITLMLGKTPPVSSEEVMLRDLMADTFDFLYEARSLIIKGKTEIAHPLARRAYESLSLMVASQLDPKLARQWIDGKQIRNAEVRRVLAKHPMGEAEQATKDMYSFFSKVTHPNRETVAHRFLGDGNMFALGAIGQPSLVVLADYALKSLNLWHWFGGFIGLTYITKLDEETLKAFHEASKHAQDVASWLSEQFNRMLAEEQARSNV